MLCLSVKYHYKYKFFYVTRQFIKSFFYIISHMSYFSCVLLSALLTHIACQDCSSLTIEAIYPCTANFLLDNTSTCMLSSCYAKNPGNPVNLTNSTACFVSCCPGFMVPTSITKDSMTLCYNQYNGTPDVQLYGFSLFM